MKHKSSKAADNYITSLIIAVSLMIAVILIFFTTIFPEQIIKLFMPGYADNTELITTASNMMVILMPYLLFVTICALLSGFLNLKGSYYIPHSSTAILNIA